MRLNWDKTGERFYETGVDMGTLYPMGANGKYANGVPWNGLTNVTASPTGAEANPQYADNQKYLNLISAEDLEATIEAFTYPKEFEECDGSAEVAPGVLIGQQNRKLFGFAYRTMLGNDVEGTAYGYKIHVIYGATASPSEKANETINDSPEPLNFSWEITTTPVSVPGYKPTAIMEINSTRVPKAALAEIEDNLFGKDPSSEGGSDGIEAHLLMPEEIIAIVEKYADAPDEDDSLKMED